jgi:hypothetical protein
MNNRRYSITRTLFDCEDKRYMAMMNARLWAQAHVTWGNTEKWLEERKLINEKED